MESSQSSARSASLALLAARRRESERKKARGYDFYKDGIEYPPEMNSALAGNEPPAVEAVRVAKVFREEPAAALTLIEKELASIEAEMEILQKRKENLEKRASPLLTKLKACDTILAPIRRVPFDVIREITHYLMPPHPTPSIRVAPLSVAQVCSAWRAAALSLPHLWATLFLEINGVVQIPRYKKLVEGWFKRANGLPLSFFIYFNCEVEFDEEEGYLPYEKLLEDFAPIIRQTRHLGLGASWAGRIFPLFADMDRYWDLKSLARLDFLSTRKGFYNMPLNSQGSDVDWVGPPQIFNQAPLLQVASIQDVFVTILDQTNSTVLPWSQLTHISLSEGLPIRAWVTIMKQCTKLRKADFLIKDPYEEMYLGCIGEHKYIEDLSLQILSGVPAFLDLLRAFNLPRLRILDVIHDAEPNFQSIPDPGDLQQLRSLHSLSLTLSGYHEDHLTAVLREATDLEELALLGEMNDNILFKSLTYPGSFTLPRLTVLKVGHISSRFENAEEALLGMIKSRCRNYPGNPRSLKKVIFSHDLAPRIVKKMEEKLQACKEEGLSLQIEARGQCFWKGTESRLDPFFRWQPTRR